MGENEAERGRAPALNEAENHCSQRYFLSRQMRRPGYSHQ